MARSEVKAGSQRSDSKYSSIEGRGKTEWPAHIPEGKNDPARDAERRRQGEKTDDKRREKREKERAEAEKEKGGAEKKPTKSSKFGSKDKIDPRSMESIYHGDPRGDWDKSPEGKSSSSSGSRSEVRHQETTTTYRSAADLPLLERSSYDDPEKTSRL